MAITKIGHMKAGRGGSAQPLMNGIAYVLNPAKTEGYLCGTNCRHTDAEGIYHEMLDVKSVWGKQGGRVGWHFIISFRKGDPKADSGTALAVAQEFCERYLGVDFQYVYAVHTDHEHIHAHIVFNSVSAVDGHKYHYADGDWEKYIQPVANAVCRKYGLEEMEIVPGAQRTKGQESGRPYVEWAAEHGRGSSWRKQLKDRIDQILPHIGKINGLKSILEFEGYEVKVGKDWLSIRVPGCRSFIRTTSLGKGYSLAALAARCSAHPDHRWPDDGKRARPPKVKHSSLTKYSRPYLSSWQKQQFALAYKRRRDCPKNWELQRKTMKEFRQMKRDVDFLIRSRIRTFSELAAFEEKAQSALRGLKEQRKALKEEYRPFADRFLALKEYDRLQEMDALYMEGYEMMRPDHEKREEIAALMDIPEVRKKQEEYRQRIGALDAPIRGIQKELRCAKSVAEASRTRPARRQELQQWQDLKNGISEPSMRL
jgi:hypothetical protein